MHDKNGSSKGSSKKAEVKPIVSKNESQSNNTNQFNKESRQGSIKREIVSNPCSHSVKKSDQHVAFRVSPPRDRPTEPGSKGKDK